MTFAAPLKLRVRLVVFDNQDKNVKNRVLDVREQEVYVGRITADDRSRDVYCQWDGASGRESASSVPWSFLSGMIRGEPMRVEKFCIQVESFPIEALGWILSLMLETFYMSGLIVDEKCRRPFFSKPLGILPMIFSKCTIQLKKFGWVNDGITEKA